MRLAIVIECEDGTAKEERRKVGARGNARRTPISGAGCGAYYVIGSVPFGLQLDSSYTSCVYEETPRVATSKLPRVRSDAPPDNLNKVHVPSRLVKGFFRNAGRHNTQECRVLGCLVRELVVGPVEVAARVRALLASVLPGGQRDSRDLLQAERDFLHDIAKPISGATAGVSLAVTKREGSVAAANWGTVSDADGRRDFAFAVVVDRKSVVEGKSVLGV